MDDPGLVPRWLAKDDPGNPFNVAGFDCLQFVSSMLAVTKDPKIAESYLTLRQSLGAEHKGKFPQAAVELACDLRYEYAGEVTDGMLYKASRMEEKWDIYLYGGQNYFCRSWTGALSYVAELSATGSEIVISRIWAAKELTEPDSRFAIRQVDYLIKSHLFGRRVPHPLPENLPREPEGVGAYSFSQYGYKCCFATYEDTIGARLQDK